MLSKYDLSKVSRKENKIHVPLLDIARMVQAVEVATNPCIRIDCQHHTPWDATLPRTLQTRDALCTGLLTSHSKDATCIRNLKGLVRLLLILEQF